MNLFTSRRMLRDNPPESVVAKFFYSIFYSIFFIESIHSFTDINITEHFITIARIIRYSRYAHNLIRNAWKTIWTNMDIFFIVCH